MHSKSNIRVFRGTGGKATNPDLSIFAAGAPSSDATSVGRLIGEYSLLEEVCREMAIEQSKAALSFLRGSGPQSGETSATKINSGEVDANRFKACANIARSLLPRGLPLTSMDLVVGMDHIQVEHINDLESQLDAVRFRMSELESQILEAVPNSSDDAIQKARFVCALVVESQSIDLDHFAFAVDECLTVISPERDS